MTSGEMTVKSIYANSNIIKVTGDGYNLEGSFFTREQTYDVRKIYKLLETAYLCNNSNVKDIQGDPTELALKVVAEKANIKTDFRRKDEIPFDSNKKYMVTLDVNGKEKHSHVKGAPEIVLEMCNK